MISTQNKKKRETALCDIPFFKFIMKLYVGKNQCCWGAPTVPLMEIKDTKQNQIATCEKIKSTWL